MKTGRDDWNSKLVNFFLHNTRLVILVLLALVAGGIFSLLSLRREGFPAVSPKVVAVTTVFPGASTKEVETQVTKVIENALKDVSKLKDVSSVSQNSFSSVVVSLDQKADLDVAVQEIRSKITSVESDLPADIQKPTVQTFATGGSAFVIGITSTTGFSTLKSDSIKITNLLSDVSGVKDVKPATEQDEVVSIIFNQQQLKDNNLTPTQISLVLKGSNIDFPAATLDINNLSQSIVVKNSFQSLEDLANQVIGVSRTGQPLKLSDVATVKKTLEKIEKFQRIGFQSKGKVESKDAVLLLISISDSADIVSVKEKLDEKISEIKKDKIVNSNLHFEFLLDQSKSTREQVSEIVSGAIGDKRTFYLLGGIQLVLLAMLLFVNWRAAIVAALAIPISFFFTLLSLNLSGIQLNTIVLFSLILVLGLIVDPAIVVLESIQRYLDLGRDGRSAVMETGRRYGAGLFIAVVTSVIVFVPFGVVSGIFGEIIKYIPITVVPALIASYFVPLAILPIIAAKFLRPKISVPVTKNEDENIWPAAKLMMKFNRWVLSSNYHKLLFLVVIGFFIFFSLRLVFTGAIPVVQFSSPSDNRQLEVTMNFPKGQTFSDRDQTAQLVEKKIGTQAGVDKYFYVNQSADSATLWINLAEKRSKNNNSKKILERITKSLESLRNVEFSFTEVSTGPPDSEYPVQVQLFDDNLDTLKTAAKSVGSYLTNLPEVDKIDDGYTGKENPQIEIVFDKTKLGLAGLSVFEASQTLKANLDKVQISKLNDTTADSTLEIFEIPEDSSLPKTKTDIENLTLVTKNLTIIKLSQVATVFEVSSIDKIQRSNNKRFVNVRAKLNDKNDLVRVQTKVNDYLNKDRLNKLGIDSTGNKNEFDDIAKSFSELGIALVIAIFLTYIVLVLQFNSFSQPTIMLFTIPLSFIGVFPALRLVNGQLGFLEILGLTILVGLVENVGIFLIDYANQLREEKNLTLTEAIILSSGVRFRPIILTKLVAIGGLLPLAILSPFWRGLSSVIIGGILVSGFLSMTVVPIFYTWFGAIRARVHRWN